MFVAVDEDLEDHPKTVSLCEQLSDDLAWAYLIRLWRWTMKYAKDGDLSRYRPSQIERAVRWQGESGALVQALVASGFIDAEPMRIHDWEKHNGRWVAKAERDKERLAQRRLQKETPHRTDVAATSQRQESDDRGSDLVRKGEVLDPGSVSGSDPDIRSGSGGTDEPIQVRPPPDDPVRTVFAHYRSYHPKSFPRPRSDSQEWRKIKARLGDGHSVSDLCDAIDGYHKTPFYCGENDRNAKYLDLEMIVRDGTHVARGIELARASPRPVLSEREMRGVRAADSWEARHEAMDRQKASHEG